MFKTHKGLWNELTEAKKAFTEKDMNGSKGDISAKQGTPDNAVYNLIENMYQKGDADMKRNILKAFEKTSKNVNKA